MSSASIVSDIPPASSQAPAESSAAPEAGSSEAPASSAPATTPTPAPASSQAPAPSSTPAAVPSSSAIAPASSAPAPASSAPDTPAAPAPSNQPDTTVVITAPSAEPSVTEVETSFITITPSVTEPGQTPSVVVITSLIPASNTKQPTGAENSSSASASASASATSSVTPEIPANASGSGLNTGGKTAIAVVVPLVVVGLLVLAGIIFWRKRKQRKGNEEERRKEVEEYGYNPNHDPTLPAVGMAPQMVEDDSGYRGWGNTATSSGRQASTTLASGAAYSDSISNPDAYGNTGSPTYGTYSDAPSGDPLMNQRDTMDSDGLAALGAIGAGAPNSTHNHTGIQRGISNASSTYSVADRSEHSGDYPGMATNNTNDYYADQGYYQANPYGNDPYGAGGQPIIRDVSARRNTQIQNPSVFPQQGNSGISQNF